MNGHPASALAQNAGDECKACRGQQLFQLILLVIGVKPPKIIARVTCAQFDADVQDALRFQQLVKPGQHDGHLGTW